MEHLELLRFDQQRSPNQPKWYPEHTENDFGNTSVPKGIVLILFGKGPIEHVGGLQIEEFGAKMLQNVGKSNRGEGAKRV